MAERTTLQAALRPGPECPELETLAEHLETQPGGALRVAAENHLRSCLHCSAEIRMLRDFEAGVVQPGEAADVKWIAARLSNEESRQAKAPSEAGWRAWFSPSWFSPKALTGFAAVAAVAIVAVGVGLNSSRPTSSSLPEFRDEIQRTQAIETVDAQGAFSWKPVPGATQYEVTGRTVDQKIIFHNTVTSQTLAFSPEVGAIILSGKKVWWQVVAKDASGNVIGTSGVQQLNTTVR